MRKLIAAVVLGVVTTMAFSSVSLAQGEASDVVLVSIEVLEGLTVTTNQDLNFGTIVQGDASLSDQTVTVDEMGGTAGLVTITGSSSSTVRITYDASVDLGDGLSYTPSISDASGNTVASGTDIVLDDGTGNSATLTVKGKVSGIDSQSSGSYTGTLTITAAYMSS